MRSPNQVRSRDNIRDSCGLRRFRRILHDDSGQATVETAFGLAALISVLILAAGVIGVVTVHLTATDMAGQIARAESRGDSGEVQASLPGVLGSRAGVEVIRVDDKVLAEVSVRLPLFTVRADAVALAEPTEESGGPGGEE